MQRSTSRMITEIVLLMLLVVGVPGQGALAALSADPAATQGGISPAPADEPSPDRAASPEEFIASIAGQGSPTSECYQLRPGAIHLRGAKKAKGRRCEPQSLPFARCRSGISSCRLGHENGPLSWFSCEERLGNTSSVPRPGSILILAANCRRKMPTGHVAYVEEVVEESPTIYRIIFTHTNYDRRCSLESNIEATYDSEARTLDIRSGAWQAWGKGLLVAGFIVN